MGVPGMYAEIGDEPGGQKRPGPEGCAAKVS